jgi:hypothetical protein
MKNNKQEPVQVVLTYNPNANKENLRAKVVRPQQQAQRTVNL